MLKHHELTDRIIKAFYKVYNKLGYGFPEKVYHNGLAIELGNQGMAVQFQPPLQVRYEGHVVGDFFPDLVVNSLVIVELKAVCGLIAEHGTQLTNYLKAAGIEVGLLLNFGPRPEVQRRVFDHVAGTDDVEDF